MAKKALIAMSGGVDSSVAALLCKESGYECTGCTMRLYVKDDVEAYESTCCSLDDIEDARSVAARLGMPYYVFNFSDEFKEKVIDYFTDSYIHGRTPNPCIECNRCMKFAKLHARAADMGCDYVVTGHYARIEEKDGVFLLKRGIDESKDQSYVLYSLTQEQLAHTLFPLGNMSKSEVRKIAEKNGFVNASKPDSQDICFVPDGDYARVIKKYTGYELPEGNFIDLEGNIMGRHRGIIHYTIGQRKGLGVTFGEPKYVCRINPDDNTVTLGNNIDLFERTVHIENINWITGKAPGKEFDCTAKIRYNQKDRPAKVITEGSNATIIFDEPQRAITPGQATVMYDGDIILGGGTII